MNQHPLPAHDPETLVEVEYADEVQVPTESRRGAFGWVISGSVHTAAILLAMVAVFGQRAEVKQVPPTRVNPQAVPDKSPEVVKPKRDVVEKTELISDTTEVDVPSPTSLDVPVEDSQSESESNDNQAHGREEAVAEVETGGNSGFIAMGAGSNSAGLFGGRDKNGRKRGVREHGGTPGSEDAVEHALMWFKRHQSPNGSWESDRYNQNCKDGVKSEPGGDVMAHGSDQNVAMTGYAVLCFLGAGYDHKIPGKHKATVRKALDWLLAAQKNDGYFGLRNYEHPIATMALAEAYAMTADPELRGPAQKAIDQILAHQNQDGGKDGYAGGLGWDYTKPSQRNDASVTGWNIMALKSGLAGGLNIGKGMEGSKKWLEQSWKASNTAKDGEFKPWKDISSYDKSRFGYCWTTNEPVAKDNPTGRESIGLVCAIFLGHLAGDTMVDSLANTVTAAQLPTAMPTNAYYLYYNTMGIFQVGGDKWTTWNNRVRDLLVNAQRRGECADGSWDWAAGNFIGAESGRVLTTAYNTLSLEVYYRNAQLEKLHPRKPTKEAKAL